jgi:hypothetical protein
MGWWNDRRPAVKVQKDENDNIVIDEETGDPVTSQTMEDVPVIPLEDLTLKHLELEFTGRIYTDSKGYRYRILRTNRFSSEGKGGRRYYNTGIAIIKEIPVERQVQVQDTDEHDQPLFEEDGSAPKMITKATKVDNLVCNPMQEATRSQS